MEPLEDFQFLGGWVKNYFYGIWGNNRLLASYSLGVGWFSQGPALLEELILPGATGGRGFPRARVRWCVACSTKGFWMGLGSMKMIFLSTYSGFYGLWFVWNMPEPAAMAQKTRRANCTTNSVDQTEPRGQSKWIWGLRVVICPCTMNEIGVGNYFFLFYMCNCCKCVCRWL